MKTGLKERALTVAVVAATAVVIGFAFLQYRWSTEVIDTTGVRMADTLQLSMVNWQLDFERNFSEISSTLRPDSDFDEKTLADRLGQWRRIARYPELVSSARIFPADAGGVLGPWQQPGARASQWTFVPGGSLLFPLSGNRQLVVSLSLKTISEQILPDLAHRYFQGTDGLD